MSLITKVTIVFTLAMAIGVVLVVKQHKDLAEPQTEAAATADSEDGVVIEVPPVPLPKLLDLGATKCVPCKMMAPILEALKEEYKGRFDVVFIDVWENPNESRKYGIKLIPTQIFFDAEGKELFRHEGFFSKEDILGKWKALGFTFDNEDEPETKPAGEAS